MGNLSDICQAGILPHRGAQRQRPSQGLSSWRGALCWSCSPADLGESKHLRATGDPGNHLASPDFINEDTEAREGEWLTLS